MSAADPGADRRAMDDRDDDTCTACRGSGIVEHDNGEGPCDCVVPAARPAGPDAATGEDATARFERRARAFRIDTGMLAPGKDDVLGHHSYEARREAWEAWTRANPDVPDAPALDGLVARFAAALRDKLHRSEAKYGWRGQWQRSTPDALRDDLLRHLAKGDPLDVAAFCTFLWARGESCAALARAPEDAGPRDDDTVPMASVRSAMLRHAVVHEGTPDGCKCVPFTNELLAAWEATARAAAAPGGGADAE
jgi:hypothetical protein